MPDIEPEVGRRGGETPSVWMQIDEAPEIPEGLPQINATNPEAPLRWWYRPPGLDNPDARYAAVGGDCGAEGGYMIAVYSLVAEPGRSPEYPRFDEVADLINAACLQGVVIGLSFIGGAELIEPPEGRAVMLSQTMVIGNTPAAQRWALANGAGASIVGAPHG